MRVANMMPDMQYAMQQSQQSLATAEEQVATGIRINQPSDDPTAYASMVVSLSESANVDQYTSNVNSVLPQLQSADSAISSIVSSLNSAITLGTSAANGTNSTANKQSIATQLEGVLSSVIGQGNTSFQGAYLFGGSEASTAPFQAASTTYESSQGSVASPLSASTPLTAGSVTTISDASTGESLVFKAASGDTIGTLESAVANAVSAGTLGAGTTATINSSGQLEISTNSSTDGIVVSSNDAAIGSMTAAEDTQVANAYAYVGNSDVNSVQVGDSMSVSTNLPGSELLTSGTNVIGALTALISAVQTGTTAQIGAATAAVDSALTGVTQARIPFDNTISQLNDQDSYLGQETVTLTSQQSSLVGANLADAATNLSQAETQNDAVLAAASKVIPESLLNYLATPSA